jgi:hypothetical protein
LPPFQKKNFYSRHFIVHIFSLNGKGPEGLGAALIYCGYRPDYIADLEEIRNYKLVLEIST